MQSNKDLDLQAVSNQLKKELNTKTKNLSNALHNAFKDTDGNHPSQLVFEAIYNEFQHILLKIDENEVLDTAIGTMFEDLKKDPSKYIAVYYSKNKNKIKAELKATLDKYGTDENFNAYTFYEGLSNNKRNIFPVVIDVFKNLALQSFYLNFIEREKFAVSEQMKPLSAFDSSALDEKIEKQLNQEFSPKSLPGSNNKTMDKLKEASTDQKSLVNELINIPQIKNTINTITNNINQNIKDLENQTTAYIKLPSELQTEILNYQKDYQDLETMLSKNTDKPNVIKSVLDTLTETYNRLNAQIETFNTGLEKKNLLEKLNNELKKIETVAPPACINREYIKIKPLTYIQDHRNNLSAIPNLLEQADRAFNDVIEKLEEISETTKKNIESSAGAVCDGYKEASNIDSLAENLKDHCRKQATFGNDLWDKKAIAEIEKLKSGSEKSQDFNEELIKNGFDQIIGDIPKRINTKDTRHTKVENWKEQITKADTLLNEYEKTCTDRLIELENQIYSTTLENAKKNSTQQLNNLKKMLDNVTVQSFSELTAPTALDNTFKNQLKQREKLAKKELQNEIKAKTEAEEKALRLAAKQNKKLAKQKIEEERIKNEKEEMEKRKWKIANDSLTFIKINAKIGALESYFTSHPSSDLHEKFKLLKNKYTAIPNSLDEETRKNHADGLIEILDGLKDIKKKIKPLATILEIFPAGGTIITNPKAPSKENNGNPDKNSQEPETPVRIIIPIQPAIQPKKAKKSPKGFFARNQATIFATAMSCAAAGAAGGAAMGALVGVPFFGVGGIIGAVLGGALGGLAGALIGVTIGVVGCAIADAKISEVELETVVIRSENPEDKTEITDEITHEQEKTQELNKSQNIPIPDSSSPITSPSSGSVSGVSLDTYSPDEQKPTSPKEPVRKISNVIDIKPANDLIISPEVSPSSGNKSDMSLNTFSSSSDNSISSSQNNVHPITDSNADMFHETHKKEHRIAEFEKALADAMFKKFAVPDHEKHRLKNLPSNKIIQIQSQGKTLAEDCAKTLLKSDFKDLRLEDFKGSHTYLITYVKDAFTKSEGETDHPQQNH